MLDLWQNMNDIRGLTKQTAWQLYTFGDFVNDRDIIIIIIIIIRSSSSSNSSSNSSSSSSSSSDGSS